LLGTSYNCVFIRTDADKLCEVTGLYTFLFQDFKIILIVYYILILITTFNGRDEICFDQV
jgi:hypothetical protein